MQTQTLIYSRYGTKSELLPVNYGIPQGSVLGPTIFMLFTNNLPSLVKSGELFIYADDSAIYCIGENVDQAVGQLNKGLLTENNIIIIIIIIIIIYQIQGVTNEPTGNSEKSEPQMGFKPTTLRDLVRML